jgi:hypothetical protein
MVYDLDFKSKLLFDHAVLGSASEVEVLWGSGRVFMGLLAGLEGRRAVFARGLWWMWKRVLMRCFFT